MSIAMLLEMAESAYGDRLAVGSRHGGGLTYPELSRAASGGAWLIRASGATRVAFIGVNGPAFPVVLFAAALAGVPVTPMNYRLGGTQLRELLSELGDAYVISDAAYLDVVQGLGGTVIDAEAWLAAAQAVPQADLAPPIDAADNAPAVLLFTSGTTSKAKGVLLRHDNLVSYVLQTVEFASAEDGDASLISVPPYHIAGVGTVLSNLYAGRRLVYLPGFDAVTWLSTVREEQITNAMVVPTMLVRIIEHLDGAKADVPRLRSLAYGGARMPAPALTRALEAFGDTGFVNAYGLTETSSTIAVLGPDDHRQALASTDPSVRMRLGSAGRPVPGIEMQIRHPTGEVNQPGVPGELFVRGPQVSGEYEGTGSVLDEQGWFATKDQAYRDAAGYLYIVGRSDDTIIRGGENIAPAEIEDVLMVHPAVRDAAVFGVPDEEWGERIVAAVVLAEDARASEDEICSFLRARLRGSRTPDLVTLHRDLPYTATGKLLRRQLIEEFIAQPSS